VQKAEVEKGVVRARFLAVTAAATYSGLSEETIRRWLRSGRLTAYRPNRRVLVDREQLDRLILASA
jgi:excisionase family DNA binding protein